jgi:hypothetical protein
MSYSNCLHSHCLRSPQSLRRVLRRSNLLRRSRIWPDSVLISIPGNTMHVVGPSDLCSVIGTVHLLKLAITTFKAKGVE